MASPGALTVTFGPASVTASGVTPGADVVFFTVAIAPAGISGQLLRDVKVVSDTAKTGTVTLNVTDPMPPNGIWAVVDATNGAFAIARPTGWAVQYGRRAPRQFRYNGSDAVAFSNGGMYLDLLYVHPGEGVWEWTESDGSATDRDGVTDGFVTVSVDDAKPVGSTAGKPKALRPGGVLIAIDRIRMQVLVERLDATLLGGGH
jgi:hypothetical protein